MMSFKLGLASVVGALCLATSVSAATCSVGAVHFTLAGATGAQCMAGNDLGGQGIVAKDREFFGLTDWALADTTVGGTGDGVVEFLTAPVTGTTSGTWSLTGYKVGGSLMIVLQAFHQYGAFLLADVAGSLAGEWSASFDRCNARGICTSVPKMLSHASVYYKEPAPVPVPAAGLMLLGGLAGLAMVRRKRKAA